MAWDIYGGHLMPGHCEIHPDEPESYPCSRCRGEGQPTLELDEWEQAQANEYYAMLGFRWEAYEWLTKEQSMVYIYFQGDDIDHICTATKEEWEYLIRPAVQKGHPIDGATIDTDLRDVLLCRENLFPMAEDDPCGAVIDHIIQMV